MGQLQLGQARAAQSLRSVRNYLPTVCIDTVHHDDLELEKLPSVLLLSPVPSLEGIWYGLKSHLNDFCSCTASFCTRQKFAKNSLVTIYFCVAQLHLNQTLTHLKLKFNCSGISLGGVKTRYSHCYSLDDTCNKPCTTI